MAEPITLVLRYPVLVAWAPPVPTWTPPAGVDLAEPEIPKVTEIRLVGIVEQELLDDGSLRATSADGMTFTVPSGFEMSEV